jgi:hypothetical protein
MRKIIEVWVVVVVMALCGAKMSEAQEANKTDSGDSKAKAESSEKPVHAYRIDISINEMEDGKKINTRHYSMLQNSRARGRVDITSRVTVPTPQAPLDAITVGTTINCTVSESGDDIALWVRGDFNHLLMNPDDRDQHGARPVVQQMSIDGGTLVTLGKPAVFAVVDDPSSNREFQLEATVTRLK